MKKATVFLIGLVVGILSPLLIDWVLFGTPTPCHTVKTFEDGSSIQSCEVRG